MDQPTISGLNLDRYSKSKNKTSSYFSRITSGQPEIIENEKGLAIEFQIIGTQLEHDAIEKTFTVNFGDIPGHQTKGMSHKSLSLC